MRPGSPLGIIAGEGSFPYLVADGARMQKRRTVAVGFKGHTDSGLALHVDAIAWLRIGQLGRLLSYFKSHGVQEVVFAGAINKPKALGMRPDLKAARFLFQNRSKNDNALLSALIRLLEEEGFSVVSPSGLASGLRMPAGVLTSRKPTRQELSDICFGWPLVKQLGSLDIGQCLV
ncbi:MAG: LpxI family protein, partial [Thermodesulfobacteriota bacterium]